MMLQPVAWFDGADGGQLTSRLGSDCASVSRMVATSVNVAFRNALQCAGAGLYLYTLNRGMAAAAAGVGAALAAAACAYGAFSRAAQRAYQDTLADATARAEESFLLSRVVRTFGAEDAACARYDETLGRLAHISSRQAVAYSSFVVANHWGYNAMRAAALLVGGSAALRGRSFFESGGEGVGKRGKGGGAVRPRASGVCVGVAVSLRVTLECPRSSQVAHR